MATRFLTEAELRGIYGTGAIDSLADRDASGTPDTGVVESAILNAEDEALSRLRGRFTDAQIPAAPGATSRFLKVLVAALAYDDLYKARAARPFAVRDGRERALETLGLVQGDQLSALLPDEPEVDVSRPTVQVSRRPSTARDEVISLDSMKDWGHFVP